MKVKLWLMFLFFALAIEGRTIKLDNFLQLGPLELEEKLKPEGDFFNYPQLIAEKGKKFQLLNQTLSWKEWQPVQQLTKKRRLLLLATYLQPDEVIEASLKADCRLALRVFLNGREIKAVKKENQQSFILNLLKERQQLLLEVILEPGEPSEKRVLDFELETFANSLLRQYQNNLQRPVGISDLLYYNSVSMLQLSGDEKYLAAQVSGYKPDGKLVSEWQVYLLGEMKKLAAFQQINFIDWVAGPQFLFTKFTDNKTVVGIFDVSSMLSRDLLTLSETAGGFQYSRSGKYLLYFLFRRNERRDKVYRYVNNPEERTKEPEDLRKICIFFPDSGFRAELTDFETGLEKVYPSPDGRTLIIHYTKVIAERPFTENQFYLFDLISLKKELLFKDCWINSVVWSPDSKDLLLLGGPSAFGGIGRTTPPDIIPNDFDTQAYIYNLQERKPTAISRNFDPSIISAHWTGKNRICFKVYDCDRIIFYRYSLSDGRYSALSNGLDVISAAALNGENAYVWASSPCRPHALYQFSLSSGKTKFLKSFNENLLTEVNLGRTEDLKLKLPSGKELIGLLYYPPDFKQQQKYPLIVNYYGGTTPVSREFGGRYPKEWYAAQGYLVAVFQPSGAVGFGQKNSAFHVNDWGKVTAEEIVAGVQELFKKYSFIDTQAVGAIGASYGGFLTMYLAARETPFAAFVSHAGISSLSSYWGGGDWGYSYSALATAESYPWNRKDIYVGHSPLYMAERVQKPLLLLHGDRDNNVPPLESYQMFLALKILKKDVALITFKDQQHFILGLEQRRQWLQAIIAWFDRYLKKQGFYWQKLFLEASAEN